MDILATVPGVVAWNGQRRRCALGRAGIRQDKREGDGATPAGLFALRRLLYRADRLPAPRTALPAAAIAVEDGWSDDPNDPLYNRHVRLPHAGRHERLWRDDALYDLILVIGHNDDPPMPGLGSAVFVHVARPDYGPTEGCVALALGDLLELLAASSPGDRLRVEAPAA